ncbi:YabP/YqfC family sporulation protein [Jeotgalibacillus soli]|uniref:Sporulation protein YqfC n=1 Tax=Jeotgalibacillus soli TaxID=889306 RepID=A0A0C2RRS4_9BACL|nr:YabP/YqfC family sporulation protein [Jeotgalibacillus soli]KIL44449.1 hypothetical protein KP78_34130 [Jeotgalibacillus soli]
MSDWLMKAKQRVGKSLHLPDDLLFDLPRMTWIGSFLLHIENHKGLLRVEVDHIWIEVHGGRIEVEGTSMTILSMVAGEMTIKGEIDLVRYRRQQGGEPK